MINNPLVSIVVITYNSSKYVIETLESTKLQTYQNIELIVSDDCSTDNTVEICKLWLKENKDRFFRTKLVTSDINTGISANCNRGILQSQAEWIKVFAGDDRLCPICIEANMDYYMKHPDATFIVSKMETFKEENHIAVIGEGAERVCRLDSKGQYEYFRRHGFFVFSPACMYKKSMLEDVGYMDERIPMMEDMPLLHNILKNGYKVNYLPIVTVEYRVSPSITRADDCFIPLAYHKSKKLYYNLYKKDFYQNWKEISGLYYTEKITIIRNEFIIRYLGNKKNHPATRFICSIFSKMNPEWWRFQFRNRINKNK